MTMLRIKIAAEHGWVIGLLCYVRSACSVKIVLKGGPLFMVRSIISVGIKSNYI